MINLYKDIQVKKLEKKLILNKYFHGNHSLESYPALFLDRDGVIIKDSHYISRPEKVILEEGICNLISFAKNSGFKIIVITNQSGISRGFYGWPEYMKITDRLLTLIGDENLFDALYANGYSDISKLSLWRKPNIGMISNAKLDLNIDIENSILIGDRLSDIEAGYKSGIKNLFHVMTGHGKNERDLFNGYYLKNKKISLEKKENLLIKLNNLSASLTFLDDLTEFPLLFLKKIMTNLKNF